MKNKRGLWNHQRSEKIWPGRKAEMLWLYNDQNWSQARIAEYYNVSQTAIGKIFKRLGITAKGTWRVGCLNGRFKDGTQSRLYRQMIAKDKCELCGAVEMLLIHHKNGDHQDNHLENLQVLCSPCHSSLHKKMWWKIRRSSVV